MKDCDLNHAPVPASKEDKDNLKEAAQANIDRFGLNEEKFVPRPRPNGQET